jgi:hypothetical protein
LQVPVEVTERQLRARLTALPIVEAVVQNRVVTLQGRLLQQQQEPQAAVSDDVSIAAEKPKGETASCSNEMTIVTEVTAAAAAARASGCSQ